MLSGGLCHSPVTENTDMQKYGTQLRSDVVLERKPQRRRHPKGMPAMMSEQIPNCFERKKIILTVTEPLTNCPVLECKAWGGNVRDAVSKTNDNSTSLHSDSVNIIRLFDPVQTYYL